MKVRRRLVAPGTKKQRGRTHPVTSSSHWSSRKHLSRWMCAWHRLVGKKRRRGGWTARSGERKDVRGEEDAPALRVELPVAGGTAVGPVPGAAGASRGAVLWRVRGGVASAAEAADGAAAVAGGELDAVDAGADAVDVVERVGEGGVVGLEREVDVADDEGGVVWGVLLGVDGVVGVVGSGGGVGVGVVRVEEAVDGMAGHGAVVAGRAGRVDVHK